MVTAAAARQSFGAFAEFALTYNNDTRFMSLDDLAELRRLATKNLPPPPPTAAPVISFDALSRARTTLDDFTRFYLPLHGLSRDAFFDHLPILVYVEACIYQMDEDNEAITRRFLDGGAEGPIPKNIRSKWFDTPIGAALRGVLESKNLLSKTVLSEMESGQHYWCLELALCAMMATPGDPSSSISLDMVYTCSGMKSFDYRVLHALLVQLIKGEASRDLLAFLRVDETLTDMADDLFDYEKDIRKNSFNVLRGCVHAVGEEAPLTLATKVGEMEKEHEALLQKLPKHQRDAYCESRKHAMRRPGSERWVFPPIVMPDKEAEARRAWAEEAAEDGGESEVEDDAEPSSGRKRGRDSVDCEKDKL